MGVIWISAASLCAACAAGPQVVRNVDAAEYTPDTVSASRHIPSKIVLADAIMGVSSIDYPLPDAAPIIDAPDIATLAHEGKAAELWSGRLYFARGKILDGRSEDQSLTALAAGGSDVWRLDNPKTDSERLVHIESGVECPTVIDLRLQGESSEANKLYLLEGVTQFDQRGRDVSCNYASGGDTIITIYASFYPDLSLEDHAAGAVGAMEQNFDIKGALPISQATLEYEVTGPGAETAAPPIAGAFDIGLINGAPYKTALWIGKTFGWHVKARATYAQADLGSEIVAAVLFGMNYMNAHRKNAIDPTTSGPEV